MQIEYETMTKNMIDINVEGIKYVLSRSTLHYAVREVFRWQYSSGTNFSQLLIKLIAKADDSNKKRLLKSYPEQVIAYLMWFKKEFFGKHYEGDKDFFESMEKVLSEEND